MQREFNAQQAKYLPKDANRDCAESMGVRDRSWLSTCEANEFDMVTDVAARQFERKGRLRRQRRTSMMV